MKDDAATGGPVPMQPDKPTMMQVTHLLKGITEARLSPEDDAWARTQDGATFVLAQVKDGRPVSIEHRAYTEAQAIELAFAHKWRLVYAPRPKTEPPGFARSGYPSYGGCDYHYEVDWMPGVPSMAGWQSPPQD